MASFSRFIQILHRPCPARRWSDNTDEWGPCFGAPCRVIGRATLCPKIPPVAGAFAAPRRSVVARHRSIPTDVPEIAQNNVIPLGVLYGRVRNSPSL